MGLGGRPAAARAAHSRRHERWGERRAVRAVKAVRAVRAERATMVVRVRVATAHDANGVGGDSSDGENSTVKRHTNKQAGRVARVPWPWGRAARDVSTNSE